MDVSPTWVPRFDPAAATLYIAIVDALQADIASGAVMPGTQLPPQREMAAQLGLSVGTVAKAYAEAGRRGLISGEVGRGTFVGAAPGRAGMDGINRPIDMTLNAPPSTGEDGFITAAMQAMTGAELAPLMGYLPHAGVPSQRAAVASWIAANFAFDPPAERVLLCSGAQHAIAVAMMATVPPGAPVLAEAATYPGVFGLAKMLGHELHGVEVDAEGVVPDALDAALSRTGARLVYCMPTLQTPTGASMSMARREAVVAILRRHGAIALEDDVYGFLAHEGPPPLAALAPDLACYVTSFAKCATPGLRLGALVVPDALREQATMAIRATGWMASPLLGAIATRMIRDQSMQTLVARKRAAAAERWAVAAEILASYLGSRLDGVPAFHLWLPLQRPVAEVIAEAAMLGVVLAPPACVAGTPPLNGLRLCLGATSNVAMLRAALLKIYGILAGGESRAHI